MKIDKETIGGIVIGLIFASFMIFNWIQTDQMMEASDIPTPAGGAAGKFDDQVNSKEVQNAIADHDRKVTEDYWNK